MDNVGAHVPVLGEEVCRWLAPLDGARLLDATFGGGGYSRRWLAHGARAVVGLDRDPTAVARGRALEAEEPRFTMREGRFGELERLVEAPFDGVAFDLGVSSFQLDAPERGFSFRADGELDMRMGCDGTSATDLLAELDEAELARLFREFGEERRARRVARRLVERRRERPFTRTGDLAEVVRAAVGGAGDIDPATRVFQALRIAVNDELGELERGLAAALDVLAPGGRLVVVAFQSLEDRVVKRFMQREAGRRPGSSRHLPAPAAPPPARLVLLTRRVVRPAAAELSSNPRARSARLRAARRVEA
ncbi:MAG: 16S rRNA (cytosine(1402)-N(4))-methyltransferase RsmH [Alphaproteobacteria bacterium]|jgi:16S rRNA (cytosine1402-N4)-methyltransferase|nr:16S rRNA (cytosine(1402)-N(4))-methyltransferase RsmH [Alphaproteobacteria bacterium]